MSAEHIADLHQRIVEQAEGEQLAGIAQKTPSGQNINCCVNKGRCFEALIEQHPRTVQAALVEQIVTEALGENWISNSLIASISLKGGVPQHCIKIKTLPDAKPAHRQRYDHHADVDENNGGTLIIPGSHRVLSDAVGLNTAGLLPTINLDAPAGPSSSQTAAYCTVLALITPTGRVLSCLMACSTRSFANRKTGCCLFAGRTPAHH